jgi:hypothetical protein
MSQVKIITALNAVTATTTSPKIWVGDYKRVAILFRRADHVAGSTNFTVKAGFGELPSDNPTMTPYNMLIDNATNTNVQMLTRINNKILSANGDAMVWMDSSCPVTHIEITATENLDGTHSAFVIGFCD